MRNSTCQRYLAAYLVAGAVPVGVRLSGAYRAKETFDCAPESVSVGGHSRDRLEQNGTGIAGVTVERRNVADVSAVLLRRDGPRRSGIEAA